MVLLSFVVLVVADLAPKTAATLHPEGVGLAVAPVLLPLVWLFAPLVRLQNALTRGLLRLEQCTPARSNGGEVLSQDELRSVVNEVTEIVPRRHLRVLVGLLELENTRVEDIMVPRAEIVGLDLMAPWSELFTRLVTTEHTHLPVYRENLDQIEGILRVREVLPLLSRADFDATALRRGLREGYFIPVGTSLHAQILHFKHHRQELGLIVNEYGDIRGLLTLRDILEEVIGEISAESIHELHDIYEEHNGSYLVNGGVSVRELNRQMGWQLPVEGPTTLNGLILEQMESIPAVGSHLLLAGYPIEVVESGSNAVKKVRITPQLRS